MERALPQRECFFTSLEEAISHEMTLTAKRRQTSTRHPVVLGVGCEAGVTAPKRKRPQLVVSAVPAVHDSQWRGSAHRRVVHRRSIGPDLLRTIRNGEEAVTGEWPLRRDAPTVRILNVEAAVAIFLLDKDSGADFQVSTGTICHHLSQMFGVAPESLRPYRAEIRNLSYNVFDRLEDMAELTVEEVDEETEE